MEYKICIIGPSGAGKTCLLNKRINPNLSIETDVLKPTIEQEYETLIENVNGTEVKLLVIDFSGQELYAQLIPIFARECICSILCFNPKVTTLQEVKNFQALYQDINIYNQIIYVATQCDLWTTLQPEIKSFLQDHEIIETSAKTGENVNRPFQKAALLCTNTSIQVHETENNLAQRDNHQSCC